MNEKIFRTISILLIPILIIIFIYASFTTWDGYFLHPNLNYFSTETDHFKHYSMQKDYEKYNISYTPSCDMGILSKSNDGFIVGNDINIDIRQGFIIFNQEITKDIENVNVTIIFNPSIVNKEGKESWIQSPIPTKFNGYTQFDFTHKFNGIHYNESGAKEIGIEIQFKHQNKTHNIRFNYDNFVDIEPAYITTQLKLTKAVVILAYWTVFFSIIMALERIKNLIITEENEMRLLVGLKEYFKSQHFFKTLRGIFLLFAGLFLATNLIFTYVLNARPDTSFTAFTFTIVSLVIACHAVIIAIDSDEKMKSIATGNFYDLSNKFWDRAPILYEDMIEEKRNTQSWHLVNYFSHGETLKKWVDPDIQEELIKRFTYFLGELKKSHGKKYRKEVKNYMTICNIAMNFKTNDDKVKDELIKELTNWLGEKNKDESNLGYLERKNNEFKEKGKNDVYTEKLS